MFIGSRGLHALPLLRCADTNIDTSSRKTPVLAHFTIHMVEIIQLYTDQPHTWL